MLAGGPTIPAQCPSTPRPCLICLLPFFACNSQKEGVKGRRELVELRRGHDSTGLRAERKLNTPLLRCASLAKHTGSSRASETTQLEKWGAAWLPIFVWCILELTDAVNCRDGAAYDDAYGGDAHAQMPDCQPALACRYLPTAAPIAVAARSVGQRRSALVKRPIKTKAECVSRWISSTSRPL